MSHINQIQYFVSQSYRQVQLSVDKGNQPYPYSDFANEFAQLLDASSDELYARQLTIELVEEAARYKQTTDYLRQEMTFEAQPLTLADRATAVALDSASQDTALTNRRLNRHTKRTKQPIVELV
ncbi:hypothetical protein GCM10028805_21630 [Spirosoma harenae]